MQCDKATESTQTVHISSWERKLPMLSGTSHDLHGVVVMASVGLVLLRLRMMVEARA